MKWLACVAGLGSVGAPAFQTLLSNFADHAEGEGLQRGAVLAALQGIQSLRHGEMRFRMRKTRRRRGSWCSCHRSIR